MSELRIREPIEGEEDRILDLTMQFLALSPYTNLFPPKDGHLAQLYAKIVEMGKIFLLVNRDDYPVGIIAGVIVPHAMNGLQYAEGVIWYVDKGHRGGSAGRNLLRTFMDWASTNGATMVKMSAPAESPVGKLLVEWGFSALETHFVLPLTAPTATGAVVLQGVTSDDLQQAVRRERQGQGGHSGEPTHANQDGRDAADSTGAGDGKDATP